MFLYDICHIYVTIFSYMKFEKGDAHERNHQSRTIFLILPHIFTVESESDIPSCLYGIDRICHYKSGLLSHKT